MDISIFNAKYLRKTNPLLFAMIRNASSVSELRDRLSALAFQLEIEAIENVDQQDVAVCARVRDCAIVLKNLLKIRSDEVADFSVAQALWDIGHDRPRPDLKPAFYAEMLYLFLGLQGQGPRKALDSIHLSSVSSMGRQAARERSRQLDDLWSEVDRRMAAYPCGLEDDAIARRRKRRDKILQVLGGSIEDWYNWHWHIGNIVKELDTLEQLVRLTGPQKKAIKAARQNRIPFGITPYYLALMDNELGSRDAAIRAQVLPPMDYVREVASACDTSSLDFMGEEDTSPVDLITRRYPAICILKPFNTCPQICVYCQRNWEIDDVMAGDAFAGMEQIDAAVQWVHDHPAIHEVLITGGDPLAMGNSAIAAILEKVAAIPTVERIRIGTRTLATLPMRISEGLAALIGKYRVPGKREVAIMTHVQHPYEITPEMAEAVNKFRTRGIPVYNQLVYTFYTSKRFEACALRRYLRLIGIDPYYTFNTKGKDETLSYRVPIARLAQEQQEEARLLPGLARTDEAVFNVPRQGKNYLKHREYRSLASIRADGARVYEFHSWEKKLAQRPEAYVATDVPILDYLQRLHKVGESVSEYDTIWYYF